MHWAEVWRRRSALAYLMGVWTFLGYVLYSTGYMPRKKEEEKEPSGNQTGTTISGDGLRETYSTEGRGFSFQSTVVYKPNSVPYNTFLQKYVQSIFYVSGGKEK